MPALCRGVKGTVTDLGWIIREASTQGHSSPCTTPWQTGNLDEDRRLYLDVCLAKGSARVCSYNLPIWS